MQHHCLVEPVAPDSVLVRGTGLNRRRRGHAGRGLRVLRSRSSRGRSRAQVTVVPVKHPGQSVTEVAQKVPAVRDLDSLGAPLRTPSA